jgi:L-asparaginase
MTTRTILFIVVASALAGLPIAAQTSKSTPQVYVIGTGGTISGGVDPATGAPKSLTVKDLVALVPGLKGKVEIDEEDYSRIGSSSMTPEIQFKLAQRVNELFKTRKDLTGIVITHGTDSLEETSFLLDLGPSAAPRRFPR